MPFIIILQTLATPDSDKSALKLEFITKPGTPDAEVEFGKAIVTKFEKALDEFFVENEQTVIGKTKVDFDPPQNLRTSDEYGNEHAE